MPARGGVKTTWGQKVDLFGFGDILAIQPGLTGSLFLQVTTKGCVTARVRKIKTECEVAARHVLKSGNRIEVWGFWQQFKGEPWFYRRIQIVLEGGEFKSYDIKS